MKILDVLNSPWAIQPEKLHEIVEIYSRHLRGDKIDIKGIEAKAGMAFDNRPDGYQIVDGVAVIPVHGVIAKRMNLFHQISGGLSTELLGQDVQHALANDDVHSIILDIDSPGGTVDGTADVAEIIYQARSQKRIVTLANGIMASGGVWIGAAASEIYIANSTTMSGSIGVVSTHVDYSLQLEQRGVIVTEIYAGRFKRINSEFKPLSKEGEAVIQEHVDFLYSVFVDTMAKFRGVEISKVLDTMADGRLFIGEQAIDAGLVDGVATMDALINMLNGGELPETNTSGFSEYESVKAIAILENSTQDTSIMPPDTPISVTAGYIMTNHADIAESFRSEGVASVDVAKIQTEAREAETKRIKSVLDQSMPGHEKIINQLAFDGLTTGPEAAVKVLQAEKATKETVSHDLAADAHEVANVSASTNEQLDQTADTRVDINVPADKRCENDWNKDANLRAEFNNDFTSFLEYTKAQEEGLIKKRGSK